MPTLHTDVYEHAGFVTVSEMRRMIARAVSMLNGMSPVTYSLNYCLPEKRVRTSNLTENGIPIPVSVSEMRMSLARQFSRLEGDDSVTFSFHCKVEIVVSIGQAA